MSLSTSFPLPKHRWPLSALALCAALMLGGCGEDNQTAEQHIQQAKEFTAQGKAKEAGIALRNALQKDPTNAQAHQMLAGMSMDVGNPFFAEVELKKALESGVPSESVKVDMARALLMQGRVEDALKQAVPGDKDSKSNQLQLMDIQVRALLVLGRKPEACDVARKMRTLQPEAIEGLHSMARCLAADEENLAEAERLIRTALEKDRNNADSWSQLGGMLNLKGQSKEAIEAYRQAIQKAPLQASTYYVLAELLVGEGKIDEGEQVVAQGRKILATPMLDYMQAKIEYRKQQYGKAQELLSQVLRNSPDYMPALLLNGAASLATGKYEQAGKDLSRYLSSNPSDYLGRNLLASSLLRLGKPTQALETLAPLMNEPEAVKDPTFLTVAGRAFMAAGQHDKAAQFLERASQIKPEDSAARTLLGMGLMQAGKTEKGLGELIAASSLDPKEIQAEYLLIAHYMGKKDFGKALGVAKGLEKKRPNDPDILVQRAMAEFAMKDFAASRASLEKALSIQPTYLPAATSLARIDVIQNKDFASARKRLDGVLAKDKANGDAMLAMANLAKWQKKDAEYMEWLTKASATNPANMEVKNLLVMELLRSGKAPKALSLAQEALSANPSSPGALELMAKAQLANDEKENALASYSKLANLRAQDPNVHFQMGMLQAKMGKIQPARQSLGKALGLAPNFQPATEALVMLELSQKNPTGAMAAVRNFQKATPRSSEGKILEGEFLLSQSRFKEAATILRQAYAIKPQVDVLRKLHGAEFRAGNGKVADKLLTDWLAKNPKDTAIRGLYAGSLSAQQRYAEAIREFEAVLIQAPENPFVLNDLAWAYFMVGDSRARSTAEKGLQRFPGNPSVQDTLGWILLSQGQAGEALKLLNQAAQKLHSPSVHYHRAAAMAKSGDKAGAVKVLKAILEAGVAFTERNEAQALLAQLR